MADSKPVFSSSRRGVLRGLGGLSLAAGIGAGFSQSAHAQTPSQDAPMGDAAFRFVFLPDIHLRKDLGSPEGFERALEAMAALDPAPAFVVTGGDLIHDSRSLDRDGAVEMADLFKEIWGRHVTVTAHHTLGNHDFAGLTNPDFNEGDPDYGLDLLKNALDMAGLFYSFDQGDWHFVVLNNFRVDGEAFIAEFDDEQMAFLREDLAAADGRPTMIFAHYPAVTAIEFFGGAAEAGEEEWSLGFGRATRNPMALVEAIGDANVRGVFSGHVHRLDRIEAVGQTFICAGSVSGAQWDGPEVDTPAGLTVVDCHTDGRFEMSYLEYEAG